MNLLTNVTDKRKCNNVGKCGGRSHTSNIKQIPVWVRS